ncbi:hypothetical protein BH24ACT3_BH24ACT3_04360 [soil metagenome]
MTNAAIDAKVSRADLERKFRELAGGVDQAAEQAKTPLLAIGAVAAVALVGLAFMLGRRRGRKTTTLVEVRRV